MSNHFLQCCCVSSKKKSDRKKLTPTQHLLDISCGTLPTTILTLIKNDEAHSKIEVQDLCGSRHTLGGPINYPTLYSSSKNAELKPTLMHKCTTFSVSRLFHRFLLSARLALHAITMHCRSKSARIAHHKTLTVL